MVGVAPLMSPVSWMGLKSHVQNKKVPNSVPNVLRYVPTFDRCCSARLPRTPLWKDASFWGPKRWKVLAAWGLERARCARPERAGNYRLREAETVERT